MRTPASSSPARGAGFALFALGFRPFFLAAAWFAIGLIALWLTVLAGGLTPGWLAPGIWHGHEMLFGYGGAVIAGFLLTAVQNWTGLATPSGKPLAAIFLVWLAGRLAFFLPLPAMVLAALDLAFLPLLALVLARPLVRQRQLHNYPFPLLLAVLFVANALVHGEALGATTGTASLGLDLAAYAIVVMIVIIAGRVIPFFIETRLVGARPHRGKAAQGIAIVATVLGVAASEWLPPGPLTATLCLLAALIHVMRLAGWHDRRLWSVPLLWVLITGYAWIPIGFVLLAAASIGIPLAGTSALHAFTAGAIGVLTLGMMARVSLGHTGRPMRASPATAIAFAAVNMAALVRVFLPGAFPASYLGWIEVSGGLWIAAFAVFAVTHTALWLRPRVDGKPG